jgi:dihydroorotate dehydrogenase electron transfer subunit
MIRTMHDHHTCYADAAWCGRAAVEENVRVARDTYRVRVRAPEVARRIVPGQFLMLRLADGNDPLLGRPLALYDTVLDSQGTPAAVDIVYLAIGRMTRRLAALSPDDTLEIWGPLGNGFPPAETGHLVMVAGGIGQTPFLAAASEYLGLRTYGQPARTVGRAEKVTLCYGVRQAEYLAGVADFERLGVEVHVSTDDGSAGRCGLVTELARQVIAQSKAPCRIVCCGPEPMLHATAELARELGVPCQVSLETPMACGIGVCFSCVAKIRDGSGQWDYRRTCVEGPVFDAEDVEF